MSGLGWTYSLKWYGVKVINEAVYEMPRRNIEKTKTDGLRYD